MKGVDIDGLKNKDSIIVKKNYGVSITKDF